jgi:hypothetical protein
MRLLPILMLLVGLPVTVGFQLLATPGAAQATVVIPPWRTQGLADVLATGLPLIDLRWSGGLATLDLASADGWNRAMALRAAGYVLLRSAAETGCAPTAPLAGDVA